MLSGKVNVLKVYEKSLTVIMIPMLRFSAIVSENDDGKWTTDISYVESTF